MQFLSQSILDVLDPSARWLCGLLKSSCSSLFKTRVWIHVCNKWKDGISEFGYVSMLDCVRLSILSCFNEYLCFVVVL